MVNVAIVVIFTHRKYLRTNERVTSPTHFSYIPVTRNTLFIEWECKINLILGSILNWSLGGLVSALNKKNQRIWKIERLQKSQNLLSEKKIMCSINPLRLSLLIQKVS